jgi:microcin C transport system ATP-binding protein
MAMLFITHDLGIVRKFADRVCVMTDGKIVETGPTAEIFANPQHAYTKHLLAAEPKGEPPKRKPSAPEVMQARDIKVWFPVKQGFLRDRGSRQGGGRAVTHPARRPDAWRRRRIRIGKDDAGAGADAADPFEGEIHFNRLPLHERSFKQMRPLSEFHAGGVPGPVRLAQSPRMSIAEIVGEGLLIHARELSA